MSKKTFTILITTKNRLEDLKQTLTQSKDMLENPNVSCIICDDGSTDGTSDYLREHYPNINLISHDKSKGYIFNRNLMLRLAQSDYAISFDDDSCFISENPLEQIEQYFDEHPQCGLIAARIFWDIPPPVSTVTSDQPQRVKGFVGCGHIWRMAAWKKIPEYPTWFIFYGEEDFASYQLFKKNWEVHYLPSVLVHHRVNLRARKGNADYARRLQRSFCSGLSLYLLFYPLVKIPRLFVYSIWMQFRLKVFKGDFKALKAVMLALVDLIVFMPKIIRNSNRLTTDEYGEFKKLPEVKLYWKPQK